jgi:outer membrane protein OmpA-like peptidoglycan-associated protein
MRELPAMNTSSLLSSALLACSLMAASSAAALEPGARLDATVVLPVSEPQRTYFGAGPQLVLTGELEVLPFLDLEAAAAFLAMPATAAAPFTQAGTAFALSAGARLKLPLERRQVLPWASLQLGWSLSGISTLALLPAVGVHFRVSPNSSWLFGPVVRLTQLFKPGAQPSLETFDASLLSFGLALEFAPRPKPVPVPAPVVEVNPDTDGDGIFDSTDRCATAPEDKDGFQDEDGCPDPDNDGDGVLDVDDLCKNEMGAVAAQGCPDQDGDEVADQVDACPTKPGKKEDAGCPTYEEVVVTTTKLVITQTLFFAFGTTRIMPESLPLLREVSQALADHQSLCVRIEGHTDAVGEADANLKLSEGRTEAVRDYLVSQGTKAERLGTKGYGATVPIDTNETAAGRERNRRVEFVIVPCVGKE